MARLVVRLEAMAAESGEEVRVVFDGEPFEHEAAEVGVLFAPGPGPDAADHEIIARVEADPLPETLRVVTSDGELADRVRAAGAEVVPAGSFRRRLRA